VGPEIVGYDRIVHVGEFLFWGVLGSTVFLVTLKAASGQINFRGLLQSSAESGISPARVQLLFLTLIGAFGYLELVVNTLATKGVDLKAPCLPDVPTEILAVLGGSSGFYLGAKGLITGHWLDRIRKV
jgi:hypothetical protein